MRGWVDHEWCGHLEISLEIISAHVTGPFERLCEQVHAHIALSWVFGQRLEHDRFDHFRQRRIMFT